jgi:hypothetical protein
VVNMERRRHFPLTDARLYDHYVCNFECCSSTRSIYLGCSEHKDPSFVVRLDADNGRELGRWSFEDNISCMKVTRSGHVIVCHNFDQITKIGKCSILWHI